MATGQPSQDRPFDHPEFTGVKLDKLDGHVYKFSIIFPMSEEGKEIFNDEQRANLTHLLTTDFGGCTLTDDVTHPLLQGTWIDGEGNVLKAKHSQAYVYASQSDQSIDYFRGLKKILEDISGEQEILIEMTPVRLFCTNLIECENSMVIASTKESEVKEP